MRSAAGPELGASRSFGRPTTSRISETDVCEKDEMQSATCASVIASSIAVIAVASKGVSSQ